MSAKIRAKNTNERGENMMPPEFRVRRSVLVTLSALAALSTVSPAPLRAEPPRTELPQPCANGACGPKQWVGAGQGSASVNGNTLNVKVSGARALLNWKSFNIGADAAVNFQQDNANALAINKIYQNDPSKIFGKLTANGQVYLINTNGILFGKTASVNVGTLVASTLDITQDALENGIASAIINKQPAFQSDYLVTKDERHEIKIEQGATLTAADGGQILVFAPNIDNQGTITTPNGQTILAAGSKIYLMSSGGSRTDKDVQGLIVEVDVSATDSEQFKKFLKGEISEFYVGNVTNSATGTISAKDGSIAMVGLAVNQSGRVSATTSVRRNGTILLRAAYGLRQDNSTTGALYGSPTGGKLTLSANSTTEILPDYDDLATTADEVVQLKSRVDLRGHTVQLLNNAHVTATGGEVTITTQADLLATLTGATPENTSRVFLDDGAVIDVSGAVVSLAAERSTLTLKLTEQLKDSPLQRDSILKGKTVSVDLRHTGVRADGTTWIGTPLADITGDLKAINRTVAERNVQGGSVTINSQGDVILSSGATIDISGGRKDYQAGMIKTTKLVAEGKVYDISAADPGRYYDGIAGEYTRSSQKWGTSKTWHMPGAAQTYSAAFSQGADAGAVTIHAPRMLVENKLRADVTAGTYQRDPQAKAGNIPADVWNNLPSTLAQPGALTIGVAENSNNIKNFLEQAIVIQEQQLLDQLKTAGFDPTRDTLPSTVQNITLSPSLFGADGIGTLNLYSKDTITVAEDANLTLHAGGGINWQAASVKIDGQVHVPSGTLNVEAVRTGAHPEATGHDVTLGTGAVLDISGMWVNDNPLLAGAFATPRRINGGSVALKAGYGSVTLEKGSRVDVSGSAWAKADGSVQGGSGGSITLEAQNPNSKVHIDGELNAYGLTRGGTLKVTTADAVCVSPTVCRGQDETASLRLAPEFFQQGGFAKYDITSSFGSLVVAADTQVHPQQLNRVLDADYRTQASGASIAEFSQITELPPEIRRAADLSLTSKLENRVETGAQIVADAGASLNLSSSSRLWVNGTLQTHGGSIGLTLNPDRTNNNNYVANQALWLGQNALLDVSGLAQLQPNPQGLRTGSVLAGGTISLTANAGYVIAEQGSRLNVSGASATLDLPRADGARVATAVASNAGLIGIRTAEGAVLEGQMDGHAGSSHALGGTLAVTVDPTSRGEKDYLINNPGSTDNRYSHTARVIDVVDDVAVSDLEGTRYDTLGAAFSAPNAGHAGIAKLRTAMLEQGGFDAVELKARSFSFDTGVINNGTPVLQTAIGVVRLETDLHTSRRLIIDSPTIDVAAPQVKISAPYVVLGSTEKDPLIRAVDAPSAADRSLTVHGQWLDVIGNTSVTHANHVTLESDHDLRLRPLPQLDLSERTLTGTFTSAGLLELKADEIYPVTLTDFTIRAVDVAGSSTLGQITVLPGDEQRPVLSAGGSVHLSASRIEQRGVIKAPFGTIELTATGSAAGAGTLLLAPGSVTSTSAEGAIIPVGQTEGGKDWVYTQSGGSSGTKLLLAPGEDAIPAQHILLNGQNVSLSNGAVMNVAGGGDLQAYEWVKGLGGTKDVLDAANPAGSFAVMPVYQDTLAPYDYFESGNFAPKAGTTVHLDGVGGLPAGEYAVLPARYALLPGAYLVTEVAGLRDRPSGVSGSLRDGTPVVTGYFGVAGTQQHEDRTRGFALVTAESLRDPSNNHRPAEYTVALASKFFPAHLAEGALLPRLPNDAGVVSISAGKSLDLQAQLRGGAVNNGRGAAVDIASANLVVQSGSATTSSAGSVALSADVLNKLGAESLLLGGTRKDTVQGTRLNVVSSNVTIAPDAQLTAPEIMLAAKDTVTLESGAAISGQGATGGGAATYVVQGDAAVLRVSGGAQSTLLRDQALEKTGSINVKAGASVSAAGSANFDVTKDLTMDRAAHIGVQGASLSVGAQQINLGVVPENAPGFNLTSSTLNGLDANELQLHGRTAINFWEVPELAAKNLVLDAPLIAARSGTDASAVTKIETGQVTLMNSTGKDPLADLPGELHGQLQVHANTIELGRGNYTVAGFSAVTLDAAQTLTGRDTGSLKVTGAAGANQTAQLTLDAGVISGQRGAVTHIAATGQVNLLASHAAPAALPDNALGASLTIDAAAIHNAARIVMPSGAISLHATGAGGVTVTEAAVLDTGGIMRDFTLTQVATPGGRVELAADQGDVNVAAGAHISVAGATNEAGEGAAAGSLTLRAPNGTLTMAGTVDGTAGSTQRNGSATIDVRHIADVQNSGVAGLNAVLNAAGFTDQRVLRVREGNVDELGNIKGQRIDVSVDGANNTGGQLTVTGTLDASGAQGGSVRLTANADIIAKSTSVIDAHATASGQKGGTVEMFSTTGRVRSETGSAINVAGGTAATQQEMRNGELHVRVGAPLLVAYAQGVGTAPVDLLGTVTGTEVYGATGAVVDRNQFVEAALVTHSTGNVTIDNPKLTALQESAKRFMDINATKIEARIKNETGMQVHVRPGLEVQSGGDITLDSPWDLSTQRYSGQPGYLTLRAKGDLKINQTLSDGFVSDSPMAGPSWSYRLIAGADMNSGPFAVEQGAAKGSLTLALGDLDTTGSVVTQTAIRTGTGDIEIATARDVVLSNKASVIYTGGVPAPGINNYIQQYLSDYFSLNPVIAQDGGDVTVRAGGDVAGQASHHLITEWLWRLGSNDVGNPVPTLWWVKFDKFADGLGALAGGNVTIAAAGSIKNVSAAIPTYGIPTGATEYDNLPVVHGGGNLLVTAGEDILGGVYYIGRGRGLLNAGGSVTRVSSTSLYPLLALGDGSFEVRARHDAQIEAVFNPTVAAVSKAMINFIGPVLPDFFTYSPESRMTLTSIAGNAALLKDDNRQVLTDAGASLQLDYFNYDKLLRILPPSLYIHAFAGDIALGSGELFPSPQGQLELLAQGNISINGSVVLSDADVSLLASPQKPKMTVLSSTLAARADDLFTSNPHTLGNPVHAPQADTPLDPPALIAAQNGDIDMSYNSRLSIAKAAEVFAGRDLVNPNITVQNINSTDVSSISAGRDLRYTEYREVFSKRIVISSPGIAINGPGDALISAGRDINLAASSGIATNGNIQNPALAASGANLTVLAGVGRGPDYDGFIDTYLAGRADYHDRLLAYMDMRGMPAGSSTEALAAFRTLPRDRQMVLLENIFFAELRNAGRSAANTGSNDYRNGYTAITTLFPDASDQGKLALYFSRIYTLDGGDINLLVPHGDINVGLTAAPESFGIRKSPDQLGIVAQGSGDMNIFARDDVQVNTSRAFTGDGGSILMWSSQGNIDAGRGAKTAISAPPPVTTVDPGTGKVTVEYKAPLNGSGIRAFVTTEGREPGDVDLFAPAGVINVNDAGIGSAGNLTIGATQVIGADNIDVAGIAVGVPVVETGALSATLGSVGGAGSSVAKSTEDSLNDSAKKTSPSTSPIADSALGFLEVQVLGYGDGDENTNQEHNAKSEDQKKKQAAEPM